MRLARFKRPASAHTLRPPYRAVRICEMHLRAPQVLLDGAACRYCQKCGAFQPLKAFSGANRTCAKQLATQTRRRRVRSAVRASVAPPAVSQAELLAPAELPAADDPAFFDFVNSLLRDTDAADTSADLPGADEPGGDRERAEAMWRGSRLPEVRHASLKLGGATPGQLPTSLAPALASVWCDDVAFGLEAAPLPGCVLLQLDALVPEDAPPAPSAVQLLDGLLASPAGAWLRARSVTARTSGRCATAGPGGGAARPVAADDDLQLLPSRLLPLALLSTAPAELRAPGWTGPPPGCQLWLRLHGQVMPLRCNETGAAMLPSLDGAEGAAHIWLAREGAAGGQSCTVLLTRDAAVAAEVASLDAIDDVTERLLCALGAALRPGCAPRVIAAAAAEVLSRGWAATAARLLPLLRAALDAGACDAASRFEARMLMHAAALSGQPALVQLTLSLSPDGALGAPHAPDERGITPMHLAASAGDGATALVLAEASPASLIAWFCARSADGATPAEAARGSAVRTHATLQRRLDTGRMLAAELAVGGEDTSAEADGTLPFNDVALARFLLRVFAPADPDAPATPGERRLYEAQQLMSRRVRTLYFPPFAVISLLRPLLLVQKPTAAAIAAIAPPALPSWYQVLSVTLPLQNRLVSMIAMNLALLAFAGAPRLRGAYERHGMAVLRAFGVLQFVLLPAIAEVSIRRVMGFAVLYPSRQGCIFMAFMTMHMAYVTSPLPRRDCLALLLAHFVTIAVAHLTGWPIWPRNDAPVYATAVAMVVHAMLALAVVAVDRSAWTAWRAARRARLASGLGAKGHKQA
jgi:hypothetical protein